MRSSITKSTLASALARRQPRRYLDRSWLARAAVALVLRDGFEVLLVERAKRRGDRWSGHLAFPGGLAQASDADRIATALRETREEAGLDLARDAEGIGGLSELLTLSHRGRPMAVSPFVFWLEAERPLALSSELAQSFWLPLAEVVAARQRRARPLRALGWALPRAGHAIGPSVLWGLSLMMLDELIDVVGA